jgi:hypothetical protein
MNFIYTRDTIQPELYHQPHEKEKTLDKSIRITIAHVIHGADQSSKESPFLFIPRDVHLHLCESTRIVVHDPMKHEEGYHQRIKF